MHLRSTYIHTSIWVVDCFLLLLCSVLRAGNLEKNWIKDKSKGAPEDDGRTLFAPLILSVRYLVSARLLGNKLFSYVEHSWWSYSLTTGNQRTCALTALQFGNIVWNENELTGINITFMFENGSCFPFSSLPASRFWPLIRPRFLPFILSLESLKRMKMKKKEK